MSTKMSCIDKKPYPLRIPKTLKDDLTGKARNNSRSLNSEIIYRLERSLTEAAGVEGREGATADLDAEENDAKKVRLRKLIDILLETI